MLREHPYHAHFRMPQRYEIALAGMGILIAGILHAASFRYGDAFWQAVTLRLFYLPVIYGATSSGLVMGFCAGSAAALAHLAVMQLPMQHAEGLHTTLQIEHHVEIPFLVIVGLITGALRDHERHEREEKYKINRHFGDYVSAEVRDNILGGNNALGGDEAEVTILFADIRNFTSLSEDHEPGEIVEMLNQYFSEMVRAISQHGGTVNKFMGDAIMAVFGAPRKLENHATNALMAAGEMLKRLQAHNFLQAAKGETTFEIGIGLSSGKVVAGNIGAEDRKEYTVIGDAVNLASRHEGLTKYYGAQIIIDEAVREKLSDSIMPLRELDSVRVKGRHAPCKIYQAIHENEPTA